MTTVACSSPPGEEGLGRHFMQLLEGLVACGTLCCYYSTGVSSSVEMVGEIIPMSGLGLGVILRWTPIRFRPQWRMLLANALFDRRAAARLRPCDAHIGFAGQSLRTFERARELGAQSLELVAASCHIKQVARRYADAVRQNPIEQTWLGDWLRRRTEREYELADVIHVATRHAWDSFIAEGVSADKLRLTPLSVAPRYVPPASRPDDGVFRVVYTGGLMVTKGVPVLVEAFRRFDRRRAELILVGGWSSRGMRRYIDAVVQLDARIRICSGDPLPHLQRADVYVHPSYSEGFGYAPAEALACGVPVIVTDDTGMKEHVREGVTGYVIPTGSSDAILERLRSIADRPLAGFDSGQLRRLEATL